jgi:hypothetical protein
MDAFFAKDTPSDQRISNWSGVRSSVTDFNNNSINVQGGTGFVDDPPRFSTTALYRRERCVRRYDAVVETIRAPILPLRGSAASPLPAERFLSPTAPGVMAGQVDQESGLSTRITRTLIALGNFANSRCEPDVDRRREINTKDPNGNPADPTNTLDFLVSAGTFNVNTDLEIRGLGAAIGQTALGAAGFNVPSLLGVCYHAPFFHNGSAQTLPAVFQTHQLPGGGTIASRLNVVQEANLLNFLCSIDGSTNQIHPNQTDTFLDRFGE